jgi:hypothetical protein
MYSALSVGKGAILVVDGMQELLQKRVSAAASMAKARAFTAEPGNLPVLPANTNVIIVAELRPGERQIPDAVVELVQATRNAPLLLLCSEPLVRPTTTVQNGRVTLLGPPVAVGRIYSHLHMLLNDCTRRKERETIPIPSAVGDSLEVVERQTALWWFGAVGCEPQSLPHGKLFTIEGQDGIGAVLSREPSSEFVLRDALSSAKGNVDAMVGTCERAGVEAFIHLSRSAKEWTAYWSGQQASVALHSAMRVPPVWCAREGSGMLKIPAFAGDTAVATSGPLLPAQQFRDAVADQGPFVLHTMRGVLTATPTKFAGLIIEVR